MPRKKLTEEGVRKLKPPHIGQVNYFDALMPGLVLRVSFGGAKAWRVVHYVKRTDKGGQRRTVSLMHPLGRYPVLGLKEAREHARQFLKDPQKALNRAKAGTFKEVAEELRPAVRRRRQEAALEGRN
jgi:hypothetical protein